MNPQYRSSHRLAFWYAFPVAALTSGSTTSNTLTLAQDSQFECWNVRISSSNSSDATQVSPNLVQIQLQDTSTGRLMSNNEIAQRIISDRYGENRFPVPVIFAPSTVISCNYTDLAAATHNVTVVLIGYKLFGG